MQQQGEAKRAFSGAGGVVASMVLSVGCLAVGGSAWAATTTTGVLSDRTGDVLYSDVKFDRRGNAMAVWMQHDGTNFHVWGSRYAAGVGWESAVRVDDDDSGDGMMPRAGFDGNGNALVLWGKFNAAAGRWNMWSKRYDAVNGWEPGAPALVSSNAAPAGDWWALGKVAFDASGNALAVWQQETGTGGGRYRVWCNRYVDGAWGVPTLVSEDPAPGDAADADLAMAPDGRAAVVWNEWTKVFDGETERGGFTIKSRFFRPASPTPWSPIVSASAESVQARKPQIAMDGANRLTLAWEQGHSDRNIYAVSGTFAGGWDTPTELTVVPGDSQPVRRGGQPSLAVDAKGNALVVWHQIDPHNSQMTTDPLMIVGSRRVAGAWMAWTPIGTNPAEATHANPRIAMNASGAARAVWSEYDGFRRNIATSRFNPGTGTWSAPALVESGIADVANPTVAIDGSGNVVYLWRQLRGSHYDLVFRMVRQ